MKSKNKKIKSYIIVITLLVISIGFIVYGINTKGITEDSCIRIGTTHYEGHRLDTITFKLYSNSWDIIGENYNEYIYSYKLDLSVCDKYYPYPITPRYSTCARYIINGTSIRRCGNE